MSVGGQREVLVGGQREVLVGGLRGRVSPRSKRTWSAEPTAARVPLGLLKSHHGIHVAGRVSKLTPVPVLTLPTNTIASSPPSALLSRSCLSTFKSSPPPRRVRHNVVYCRRQHLRHALLVLAVVADAASPEPYRVATADS